MNQRVTLAVLLSFCTLLPALGQVKPADDQDDVVKITTNLVQIDVAVTKDGKPVRDLRPEDFEIYEDGKKQAITSFAFISNVGGETPAPPAKTREKNAEAVVPAGPIKRDVPRRIMAIVVDDLGLSAESMTYVRRSVRKFIAEQMQPNDLVAVLRTGGEVGALQQFTNDKRLLNRAADQLRWNMCSRVGINVLPQWGTPSATGCLHSYRSTLSQLRSVVDAMGQLPGRKSLVLMSDSLPVQYQELKSDDYEVAPSLGDDWIYRQGLNKVAERAIRSSVVIYSIDTQGLQPLGPTAADSFRGDIRNISAEQIRMLSSRSRLLQDRRTGGDLIARETGGFQIRNSNDYQLDRVLEDQSGYYLLGYRPTDETFNKKFHHLKAKVKRSGLTLRTRNGFYGVSEEDIKLRLPSPVQATNLALRSPFGAQELELDLSSFFTNDKIEGSLIRSFLYVDANNLDFKSVNEKHETPLEIHGVMFGDNGAVAQQVRHGVTLSLTDEQYEQAKREGLRLRFDMPVKRPGDYQVRIAVREGYSYKIGSAGQYVAVPDLNNRKTALSGIVLRGVAEGSTESSAMSNPAVRRFRANSDLYFAFAVYNGSPNLLMQTKLFRDGKPVKSSELIPIDVANQTDPARLFTTSVMRLTPDLEPGNYYLQVVITDKTAKEKEPPAVQWIDFEIVK